MITRWNFLQYLRKVAGYTCSGIPLLPTPYPITDPPIGRYTIIYNTRGGYNCDILISNQNIRYKEI